MASQDDPLPPPRVRLPQGTYEGRIVAAASLADPTTPAACPPTDVDVFLGIPYAQSTAGDHRFAAPVPLAVVPGDADRVHAATQLGQRCPSSMAPDPALRALPEGEDCLNVNVYRPRGGGTGLLPVVVYVHGGSFNGGLGAGRDMASFVGYAAGRVVGVSFNYRLGALGFLGWLADPATGAESADAPLNAGLLDQQALFAWVRANIGFFGGDAGHVTLMGLSAGAHAVAHHMLCYAPGQAPFHKVVCESGAATARSVWGAAHPRPQAQLRAFLAAAGVAVPPAADDDATATATVLAALRALPLATIVAAARRVWDANQASLCWPFQPVVGGRVIPVPPSAAWASGLRPGLPVLTGFCSHEGTYFVPADRARADTDAHVRAFFCTLLPAWADADDDAFGRLYPDPVTAAEARYANPTPPPPGITGCQWTRLEAAYARYAYICPVLETARVVAGCADAGPAAPSAAPSAPVFVYEYAAHALPWSRANHGDNQLPVAHNVAPGPTNPAGLRGLPGLTAVADAMHGAWVAFATAPPATLRAPGGLSAGGIAWPAWTPAAQHVMVFGAGNNERVPAFARPSGRAAERGTVAAVRALTDDERAQCAFWRARRALGEGTGQAA